jgi:hypothetical protein
MLKIDDLDKKLYGYHLAKIYGPYNQTYEAREIIVLYYSDKVKRTLSYPKYLMERKLGRLLEQNETVDHIDEASINNNIENLQILSREDNIRKSQSKYGNIDCLVCNKSFKQKYSYSKYCSNKCRYKARELGLH